LSADYSTRFPTLLVSHFLPWTWVVPLTEASLLLSLIISVSKMTHHHCESFYRHYTAALENSLEENSSLGKGRILPGVRKLLPSLTSHFPEHVSALLTGNAEQGARIKLRHYELDKHFSFGAFGCDHPERNQLGPIAIERAQKSTGRTFDSEEVIVIGDTPRDIACARACGAKVLAVSTGTVPHEDLKKAEPDALLRDFSNLDETLSTLEGLFPASSSR
jgi:phosphoglycolate phosphatase